MLVSYFFIGIEVNFDQYHFFINFIRQLIEHMVQVLSEQPLMELDSVSKNLVIALIISIITVLISFYSYHPSLFFSSFQYPFLLVIFFTGLILLIMLSFIKFHFIFIIQSLIFLIQFFIFLITFLILFFISLIQLLKSLVQFFLTPIFFDLLLVSF